MTKRSLAALLVLVALCAIAQEKKTGVLDPAEAQKLVPQSFFYAGQTAPSQLRNSAVVRVTADNYVLASLVDNSGYSTGIAQKYQGFLITEVKLFVGDSALPPGAYGIGINADSKFVVTDVGAHDLFTTTLKQDDNLKRARPLQITAEGDHYRLYLGKKYVDLSFAGKK
jgi:hypothetical protein